jgi:uncharacterized membrane protein
MKPVVEKIVAPIVIGLSLPLLLYQFRVNPWSQPARYWGVFVLCFGIAFLVYKYRNTDEGRIPFRTHLINFAISLLVLCVVAAVYLLMLATLYALT